MSAVQGERSDGRNDVRKAVAGASIRNAVEWFDFAIYGFLATFIAANFFPSGNETAALLNTLTILAAAFFMRPLGGFVFGPLGDRIGRQRVLASRHPADVRFDAGYSGFSIGYNICVAAFGGSTPYVVTWLTAQTANNVAPAYYVVVAAIVSLLTILTIRETAGRPLPQGVADEMFQSEPDVRGLRPRGSDGVTVRACRRKPAARRGPS